MFARTLAIKQHFSLGRNQTVASCNILELSSCHFSYRVTMVQCVGGWSMNLLVLLLLAVSFCSAQLTRDEKQQILDLHNYYRASVSAAGMRRMVR